MQTGSRAPRTLLVPDGQADLHVADMTATFSASLTLQSAQEMLARHGQWLAIDGEAQRTLDDLVSTNSTGPLRLSFGGWRDQLLGVQFYNGKDELITVGGRTMKNVAGYDVTKLMVGQRGVFGRIATITVRTYLRPAGAVLARFAPDVRLLPRLLPTRLRPQWAMLSPDGLFCGYLSDERTLSFYRRELENERPLEIAARPLEDDIHQRQAMWRTQGDLPGFRASIPPARVMEFTAAIGPRPWVADAALGIVLGSYHDQEDAALVRSSAQAAGGTVMLFDRDARLIEYPTHPAERALLQRLKQAFDPDGRLAPL